MLKAAIEAGHAIGLPSLPFIAILVKPDRWEVCT